MPALYPIFDFSQAVSYMLDLPDAHIPLNSNGSAAIPAPSLNLANQFNLDTYGDLLYDSLRTLKIRVITSKEANNDAVFQSKRYDEIYGLIQKGIFEFVPRT